MRSVVGMLLLVLSACASVPEKVTEGVKIRTLPKGQTVFATAYADIPKGASMPMVMGLLGNPAAITSEGQKEVWLYRPRYDKQLLVYFLNAGVTDVKEQ